MSRSLIDLLRRIVSRAESTPFVAAAPAMIAKGEGRFQGKLARQHPAVKCGKSILDKSFAVEFRTPRETVCVEIGDECILKNKIIFESDTGYVKIGNGCYLGNSTFIASAGIEVGNWVTMAWGITLYDHNSHSLDYRERINDQKQQLKDWGTGNFIQNKNWSVVEKAPIKIGDYAWIGFDALILKGVSIGEGAVVGAKSVVTKNVEPWTVVAGNPARVVKRLTPGDTRSDRG